MKKSQITILKKVAKSRLIAIIDKKAMVKDGRIYATNLETQLVQVSFPTNIVGEGVIKIEAIEKDFDSAEIRDGFLFVTRGKSVSKSIIEPIDDFPTIFKTDTLLGVFNDMKSVREIAQFAGNDPIRPIMSCIHIDETNLVCTDAHRMAWREKTETTISGITLRADNLSLLSDDLYSVWGAKDNPTNITFASENESFNFVMVEGRYPDYKAVTPRNNPLEITVNTKELITALKNAEPSVDKVKKQVIFSIFENKLTVSAADIDRETEFSTELPVSMNMDIEPFKIAFNFKFMLSMLSYETKETTMSFSENNRASIINGKNLLMPVIIEAPDPENEAKTIYLRFKVTEKQPETIAEPETPQTNNHINDHVFVCTVPKPETVAEIAPVAEIAEPVSHEVTPEPEPINQSTNQPINEEEKPAEFPEVPVTESVEVINPTRDILIIDYSEKAIAVFGDTDEFHELFASMYGIYKPGLTIQDVKIGGWIFSKKRRAQIEKLINA